MFGRNNQWIPNVAALLISITTTVCFADSETLDHAGLTNMVRQDCGSCHGYYLKGGLGPPLRPSEIERLDINAIRAIIKFGKPDTAMPPWKDLLTDAEIAWISQGLLNGDFIDKDPQ
ncbi:hypothetical protein BTA51_13515 [Hahella sp. CCB-MM4]|uniref:c-type cytochrome n=1 Tax=Hahella sp. (strain CCB-MM4) TaxID=1926491 RepID=UPI000B9A9588|nr:cytochrome c [Hahella sp. CCB-MM4]OZG72972.1 hypothetical protein BTA51_13515 [Hahella sp. CCB-MM4]